MRIIQTFWSGGRDPLQYGYGWRHAEHNLMSWALSCCSLREHYDQVELYTDQRGYDVLIEKLHLPYTAVHVVYDDHLCLPQHWAYAKIKTYSMQTEPFLHVDGDVYISKPFPEEVLNAALVVQNEEIGTAYYRSMLDSILKIPNVWLPDYVRTVLDGQLLPSYNMGVFGGNDLKFIHDYCKEATSFIVRNELNNTANPHSHVDCNVFFEQMLFAIFAKKHGRELSKVIPHAVRDNGYTQSDFCDIYKYAEKGFFHLLGGHKRVRQTFHGVADMLLLLFPKYYDYIVDITDRLTSVYVHSCTSSYEKQLNNIRNGWRVLDKQILQKQEKLLASGIFGVTCKDMDMENLRLSLPQFFNLISVEKESQEEKNYLLKNFKCERNFPLRRIALTPSLIYPWTNEFPLIDEDEKIISLIQRKHAPVSIRELQEISVCEHKCRNDTSAERIRTYVMNEVCHMVKARILTLQQKESNH
ncbi:MAG: DUF6734 family protein [Bacteroidaceae bacterium]